MSHDSLPFPATFPLNLEKRRKRSHRDDSDNEDDTETPSELLFNILQDIQTKVVNLTTIVNEVSAKLDSHIESCGGDSNVKALKDQILSTQQALMSIDNSQYEEDKRRKFRCIPKWGELHKKRRDAYYKHFTVSSIADIMENFLSNEEPYIMRAYRPKYSPGEKSERYKLREKHAISTMQMDIDQKRITAREQFEIYTDVDTEVSRLCDELENQEDRQHLKELWLKEISAAEEKSQVYFNQKKRPWWINLPEKYPYNGQISNNTDQVQDGTSETSNPPTTTNNQIENNAPPDEEDLQMDVGENESSTTEGPWINVSYRRRGQNSELTRTVQNPNQTPPQNKETTSQNRPNQTTHRSSSKNRGGYRGRSSSRNRGGYRGQNSNRSRGGNRGFSRGSDNSYSRGRSRGRGRNYGSRQPDLQNQGFH